MPKQACVDCHFFTKEHRDKQPAWVFVVDADERAATRQDDFAWHSELPGAVALSCAMEVWDQGVSGFPHKAKRQLLVERERKDFCFFLPYHPGMLIPAAKELQRREMEAAKTRKELRLTIIGLWIAAVALLLSVALEIVNLVRGPSNQAAPADVHSPVPDS